MAASERELRQARCAIPLSAAAWALCVILLETFVPSFRHADIALIVPVAMAAFRKGARCGWISLAIVSLAVLQEGVLASSSTEPHEGLSDTILLATCAATVLMADRVRARFAALSERAIQREREYSEELEAALHRVEKAERGLEVANACLEERIHNRTEELTVALEELKIREADLRAAHHEAACVLSALNEYAAVARTDSEGRFSMVNERFERLTGYSSAEVMGRTPQFLHSPEDWESIRMAVDEAFARGETSMNEVQHVRKSGERFWAELKLVPTFGESGQFEGAIAMFRDVTARRESEAAIRKLSRVVEQSPASVVITDRDGAIEYVNPAFEELTGFTKEEALGLNPRILKSGETVLATYDDLWAAITAGKVWRGELCNRKKNGELFWEYATITGVANDLGEIIGYSAVKVDITHRKRAEQALQESMQLLERSQSVARLGSYVLDIPGDRWHGSKVLDEVFGIQDESFPKTVSTWLQIVHPEERHHMLDYFQRHVLQERNPFDKQYRIVRQSDGSERRVHGRGELRFDDLGNPVQMIGVIQDITDQNRMGQELADARFEVVQRLALATEYRDSDTGAHIQRIGRYCEILGDAAGLSPHDCETLKWASTLHDIGKLAIPDSILLKPGKLSEDEVAIMRTHTTIGSNMLSGGSHELLRLAETIASTHHERWDGTGYPNGLAGEQIPLAGRICAISDVFDALTSERPYKRAWPVEQAFAEIVNGAGTQFDPNLVELFLACADKILKVVALHSDVPGKFVEQRAA